MSSPPRQSKSETVHDSGDYEEYVCPPPLRQRLAEVGRGILSISTPSSSPDTRSSGRGLLAKRAGQAHVTIGEKMIPNNAVSNARPSRTTKTQALRAIDMVKGEQSDSASDSDNDEESDISIDAELDSGSNEESGDSGSEESGGSENQNHVIVVVHQYEVRDGTVWQKAPVSNSRRQAVNIMRAAGGLSAVGRRLCAETAISNWHLFFDEELLDIIVNCTNDKARSMNANFMTDQQELSTFIGVTILIGVYKGRGEPVRAVWSESEGRKCISQFMSRNRYELMTKYLRFDLTSTRQNRRRLSKFAPMGIVYDVWEQRLSRPFIPHEYVTVDETLVSFRGRCNFKQYMPSKPAKYGLKFCALCDAVTGYCLRMKPYLGTDNGSVRAAGLGHQVVLDLTEHLDAGRTVVTDNFFTSLALLKDLRIRKLGLIGTIRKNRREIPEQFTNKKREAGSSLFAFNEKVLLVSYSPKKNKCVVLLSSEHTQPDVDPDSGKPQVILAYNKSKGGVDHFDQMCVGYTTRKRTQRWPKCVFQHMVDVSAFNAFVLWREVTGKGNAKRRQFLKMLGAELCGDGVDEQGNIRLRTSTEQTTLAQTAVVGTRQRCRKCKVSKTVHRCQVCQNHLCINCASYACPSC
jgi:hypothetical protein